MRLGIAVVYLVHEEDEKLLDIHLEQIEKYTRIPYNIYAAANRLVPRFKEKLERSQKLEICRCPETRLRFTEEHAFYLEHLIERAARDNVTHIVTLHVDSFPVKQGWAEDLASKLDDSYAFAAVMRHDLYDPKPVTACLFFPRDFYIRYKPRLLLTKEDLASKAYQKYPAMLKRYPDSGIGYGFKAFSLGLSWYPLKRSNRRNDHPFFAGVFGDVIFHLGGAVRVEKTHPELLFSSARLKRKEKYKKYLPETIKERLRGALPPRFFLRERASHKIAFDGIKQTLYEDPDHYIQYLIK